MQSGAANGASPASPKPKSVTPLADVLYTIRLATLSPRIIRAALSGDLPDGFSLQKVRKIETDDWEEQERLLGFPPAT